MVDIRYLFLYMKDDERFDDEWFFINLINVLRILIFLYIGKYIVLFMEKSIGVFI